MRKRNGRKGTKPRQALLPRVSQQQSRLYDAVDLRVNNVFNLRHRCRLRYFDTIDLGVFGSSPVGYVFAANGLYDPDITGTGHQPMGFDQLSAFFQHHCVLSSSIRVTFANEDGTTHFNAALCVQRSASLLSVYPRIVEAGNCVTVTGGGAVQGGGPPPPVLHQKMRTSTWQGVPQPLDDNTLKGTPSANPTTLIYYAIYVVGPVMTSTGHMFINVQLDYDAVFTEPFQPVES